MKKILFMLALTAASKATWSQGCVAIRSLGNSCSMTKPGEEANAKWQLNLNSRYFKSYKHFVGSEEQKHRVDSNTEVINHTTSLDITLTRNLTRRWSLSVTLPVINNQRSSKYEHYGNTSKSPNARRTTSSFGIGDARISVYRWLLDSSKSHKSNIQVGLGLKLPTGDYRYQDFFYKTDSTSLMGAVDQSIQLGDGGTGIALEAKTYYNFSKKLGAYADVYYLVNPREQNGVSTTRGATASANAIKYFTSTMSVPDQYMARVGATYMLHNFSFSAGARIEGIPSSDLVGGDKGFRRPGYVVSAEPVVSLMHKNIHWYLAVPVALERNRTQSNADKLQTKATGIKAQGDAAFADYAVNLGCSIKF